MKKKILSILGGVILLVSLILNFFFIQKAKTPKNTFKVFQVIDGDTFVLENKQTIRLINIEAPELEFCGGPEAKEKLSHLIEGKNVRLEIITKDTFKRPLALVYFKDTLINEILLKEGLARYDGSPSPARNQLKKAYDEAFENKIGIHSPKCRAETPPNSKCLIKGNVEKHSKTKSYYFPGCANYQITIVEKDLGEDWFCTEEEAQAAGFVKSKNCYGKTYQPPN